MAGQLPRQGWIYMLNPYRVSLQCSNGHQHFYALPAPEKVECFTVSCDRLINSSRVFRGTHPHIVWTSDQFQDNSNYVQTFAVIPLTSQSTFVGLPTTYPIPVTTKNGLTNKSYGLIHQLYTIDGNCLKDDTGKWLQRDGQLNANDKIEIQRRLQYFLGFNNNPNEDWFKDNATPKILENLYGYLSDEDKNTLMASLLDNLP